MVIEPTITTAEVIAAALTLEKMSKLYEYANPELGEWTASDLRGEIPFIDDLEVQQKARLAIALQVVDKVYAGLDVQDAVTTVLARYEISALDEDS